MHVKKKRQEPGMQMEWNERYIMEQEPILTKPVSGFQMSTEFERMCLENGFITFGDILLYDTPQLLNKPGFDYRILREFYAFLSDINKNHLLRD